MSYYLQSQEVVDIYAINASAAQIRHAIRRRFERNRHITDPRAIDVLLLKGWQEYQETMNVWKQRDHILGILLEDQGASRPPRSFLQKFYEGGCMTWIAVAAADFAFGQARTRMLCYRQRAEHIRVCTKKI
jgi:Complex 1 protein (LYR family)